MAMMTWVEKEAGTRIRNVSLRRVSRDVREGRASAMSGIILSQTCDQRRRLA